MVLVMQVGEDLCHMCVGVPLEHYAKDGAVTTKAANFIAVASSVNAQARKTRRLGQ
jgi:hypothetical protein